MNPDYIRVIPRDLFNEAKLLKCVGRLCLLIHDGLTPFPMECDHDGDPFQIALMDEGALTITNLVIVVNGAEVFTEHGDFSDEFKAAFT